MPDFISVDTLVQSQLVFVILCNGLNVGVAFYHWMGGRVVAEVAAESVFGALSGVGWCSPGSSGYWGPCCLEVSLCLLILQGMANSLGPHLSCMPVQMLMLLSRHIVDKWFTPSKHAELLPSPNTHFLFMWPVAPPHCISLGCPPPTPPTPHLWWSWVSCSLYSLNGRKAQHLYFYLKFLKLPVCVLPSLFPLVLYCGKAQHSLPSSHLGMNLKYALFPHLWYRTQFSTSRANADRVGKKCQPSSRGLGSSICFFFINERPKTFDVYTEP